MRNRAILILCGCAIIILSAVGIVRAIAPDPSSAQNLEIRQYRFSRCISMPIAESEVVIEDEQTLKSRWRNSPDCQMAYSAVVDFQQWTLVGRRFRIPGGCPDRLNPFAIAVTQDPQRRVYRHTVSTGSTGSGACAGEANLKSWILVPKLPTGYRIDFQQLKMSNLIMDCGRSWDEDE